MAKGVKASGLDFTARLNTTEALKKAKEFRAELQALYKATGVSPATGGAFDCKPLSEYQKGILAIKQQSLDLAKQKADQAAADRAASLALQAALRDEANIKRAAAAQEKKDKADAIAQTKQLAEEARKAKATFTDGSTIRNFQTPVKLGAQAPDGTRELLRQLNEDYKLGLVTLKQYNAESARLNAIISGNKQAQSSDSAATRDNTDATKQSSLSKRQLAIDLAAEKLRQQQSTAETKNNAREMMNAKGSLEQRRAALIRLTAVYDRLSDADRKSSFGIRLGATVKGLSEQIGKLEADTNRFGRNVNNYGGAAAAFFTSIKDSILSSIGPMAAFTLAISAAKAAFHNNVEISDAFVDVQRTAKESATEVDALGEKLKKINTRTSLEGLLDIGFIGGRLGVAKDDLVGFITQVDELAVVLKKEFPGGAEAVAQSLGKIISVYKLTQREGISLEDALRKVGSAVLEVSHNGGAPVAYLQEFALKTASIAQVANISLPTILAYGAVLSKAGVQASTAATGVTRLISDLSTKREKYFAIAQLADSTLTLEKFTKLINTDTKAALELFFKGLKAGNPVQTETSDRLDTLSLKAGRVKTTVISLAEAQEQLFEKTSIANKGYEDGTSIAHNFELANNTLAAAFEKLGNRISNAFIDSGGSRFLATILNNILENKSEALQLADAYEVSKAKIDEFDASLKPLIERYDELKKYTVRNKDEQAELRDVTAQIGVMLPGLVTKFDNYGNAIDINRGKVQELTKAQRDLLELQNRGALKTAVNQFDDAQKYLPGAKAAAVRAAKLQQNSIDRFFDYFAGGDSDKEAKQNARDKITKLSAQAYEAAKAIRSLGGELTKAQKDVLNYYEVVNKPKPKTTDKQNVIVTGDGTEETNDTPVGRTVDDIKADIKRVTELKKPLDVASSQYKAYVEKLKGFKKELKLANGGIDTEGNREANQYKTALKARNDLQARIGELTKKGTDKQLTSDDQEVESVKDKYAKMLEAARKFNNDPDNKKKGLRVDAGGLQQAQGRELVALGDKQSAEKLKVTLDAQKKMYDEYESYKSKVGETEANKRYGKDLNNYATYLEALNAKRDALLNQDQKSKGGSEADNAAVQLQLKLVDEEIAAEKLANKKKNDEIYADAYQSALTNAQALIGIETDYQRQVKALGKNATAEQIENLTRLRDERIRRENEANAEQQSGYAKLMENFDAMSRGKVISELQREKDYWTKKYKSKLVTAEFYSKKIADINSIVDSITGDTIFNRIGKAVDRYKKAKKDFDDATDDAGKKAKANGVIQAQIGLFDAISKSAGDANEVIGALASSFSQLGIGGDGLQDTLKGVMGAVDGLGSIAKGIASGNPVDIVTGSISLLTSAINLFSHKDKDLQKKIDKYKVQLNSLGQAYQQLQRDVTNAVGENIYTDQQSQIDNLIKQQGVLSQMRDAESAKKKADKDKIQEFQNQIDAIPGQIEDIKLAISQNLIQTTFRDLSNSLADAFTDAFAAGEDAAGRFDDVFDKVIANAIKNSLKLKILDPIVKKFTDDLTKYAQDNNNSIIGFDFNSYKDQLKAAGDLFSAGLKGSEDFFKGAGADSSSSAVNKGITQITSDQANALEGIMRGQYDQQKKTVALLTVGTTNWGKLVDISMAGVRQLEMIQANTANTVTRLDATIDELKKGNVALGTIASNTKSTSGRGNGLPI